MAAIDFPASPTVNDTFTAAGRTWIWTGTVWDSVGDSISAISPIVYDSGEISLEAADYLQLDTTYATGSTQPGQIAWNDVDGTLEFRMKGNTVTQQIGMEQMQLVKSSTNGGLTEGSVVYIVGSDGSNATVDYAKADAHATVNMTIGVMTDSATGGAKAYCTTFGMVRNIDTSAFTEGATLWVSPSTAGALTTTRPAAPYHATKVGYVIRSHATLGVIFVSVQRGDEIDDLHNVAITSPVAGQTLSYNGTTWVNSAAAAGGEAISSFLLMGA